MHLHTCSSTVHLHTLQFVQQRCSYSHLDMPEHLGEKHPGQNTTIINICSTVLSWTVQCYAHISIAETFLQTESACAPESVVTLNKETTCLPL